MTQGRSVDDGAHAAQRRADASGANSERRRQWLRDLTPQRRDLIPAHEPSDADEQGWSAAATAIDGSGWSAAATAIDGTAHARDQAARMHDNAATMHDEAVRLGIGDSDEHRRSAARHREAATSHRPTADRPDLGSS